jgi:DNA-binding NarL/FixJ family response regulator
VAGKYGIVAFAYRRDLFDGLTQREREVLALVGLGMGNKGIAYRLGIGLGTVKKHFVSINKKLGAVSRAELARLAVIALPAGDPRQEPKTSEKPDRPGLP